MAMLDKKSLVDQVYEQLRHDIISLRFPFGSKVKVNELQAELEVSATPIREALNRLQQEGLVNYRNNIGASIISLTDQDVREIQYLASSLHCAAIELTMERVAPADLVEQLRPHLKRYQQACTPQQRVDARSDFIGIFYHNCGNSRLHSSIRSIQGQQVIVRQLHAQLPDDHIKTAEELEIILQAAGRGDTRMICEILRTGAKRVARLVIEYHPAIKRS